MTRESERDNCFITRNKKRFEKGVRFEKLNSKKKSNVEKVIGTIIVIVFKLIKYTKQTTERPCLNAFFTLALKASPAGRRNEVVIYLCRLNFWLICRVMIYSKMTLSKATYQRVERQTELPPAFRMVGLFD